MSVEELKNLVEELQTNFNEAKRAIRSINADIVNTFMQRRFSMKGKFKRLAQEEGIELTDIPEIPDIGPPEAPEAPGPMPPDTGEEPRLQPSSSGPITTVPPIVQKMNPLDQQEFFYWIRALNVAIQKGDPLAVAQAADSLKKLLSKYQYEQPLTSPRISIYSLMTQIEKQKAFQDKNLIINASAEAVSKVLYSMNCRPISASLLSVESYDYDRRPRNGVAKWKIDFIHRSRPSVKGTIIVKVEVKNGKAKVDNFFEDQLGNKYPFDSFTIERYIWNERWKS